MTGMEITEVLGNLGDFIGGIAVFGTIVYLAIQVRQGKAAIEANTQALHQQGRLVEAQASQTRAVQMVQHSQNIALSGELADIYQRFLDGGADQVLDNFEALSPTEQFRVRRWELATVTNMQSQFDQYERGFLAQAEADEMLRIAKLSLPIWHAINVRVEKDAFVAAAEAAEYDPSKVMWTQAPRREE